MRRRERVSGAWVRRVVRVLVRLARRVARSSTSTVAVIVGAPDYEAYLAHAARRQSSGSPLSRDAFARAQLEQRYHRPGARCC